MPRNMPTLSLPLMLAALIAVIAITLETSASQKLPGNDSPVVCRIVQFGEARFGTETFLAITLTSVKDNQTFTVTVNNEKESKGVNPEDKYAKELRGLKAGDFVRIKLKNDKNRPRLTEVKPYKIKPGEELPNNAIFDAVLPAVFNGTQLDQPARLVVFRLGEKIEIALPMIRAEQGPPQPDPALMTILTSLRKGDVVTLRTRPAGAGQFVLISVERFHPPRTGDFGESFAWGFNPTKTAIRINGDDSVSYTIILPGRMVKEEWVTDARFSSQIEKLKKGDRVTFEVTDTGAELILKSLRSAPPRKTEPATGQP